MTSSMRRSSALVTISARISEMRAWIPLMCVFMSLLKSPKRALLIKIPINTVSMVGAEANTIDKICVSFILLSIIG